MNHGNRNNYQNRRGGGGGYRNSRGGGRGYDQFRDTDSNRKRPDSNRLPEVEDGDSLKARLSMLLLKIGDKVTTALEKNLDTLSRVLIKDFNRYSTSITDNLKTCVVEIPSKTPIYGTLIALIMARDETIGSNLVKELYQQFQTDFNLGKWREVKIWLRLLGELGHANAFPIELLANIYKDIVGIIPTVNQKDMMDCFAYLVMASLPWGGDALFKHDPVMLESLIFELEQYMAIRSGINDNRIELIKPLDNVNDQLDLLFTQIQSLKSKDYDTPQLLAPHVQFETQFSQLPQITTLPPFQLPSDLTSLTYKLPQHQFTIYPNHQQFINDIQYFIISDIIFDTIDIFHTNRRECVRMIFNLKEAFKVGYFQPLIESEDKEETEQVDKEENEQIDKEEIDLDSDQPNLVQFIIEVVLNKLFQLPNTIHNTSYYAVLLIESCKVAPRTFPPLLESAVFNLYSRCKDMDVECMDRFSSWLSHHLSNFEFRWDWEKWFSVIELNEYDSQRVFLKELLQKVVRLSYYDKAKATIPEELHSLMPPTAPEPNFSFRGLKEDAPHKKFCALLVESFKQKAELDTFKQVISDGKIELNDDQLITKIVIETILMLGSKSYTHMMNVTEKYLGLYQILGENHLDKAYIVEVVGSFWSNHPQWLSIQLDKLLNYHVIEPISIINWIFSKNNQLNFLRNYLWDILFKTINKLQVWVEDTEEIKMDENDVKNLDSSNDLKEVLFAVMQNFATTLTTLVQELDNDNLNLEDHPQYQALTSRFIQFGRLYHHQLQPYRHTFKEVVFVESTIDERVRQLADKVLVEFSSPKIN